MVSHVENRGRMSAVSVYLEKYLARLLADELECLERS